MQVICPMGQSFCISCGHNKSHAKIDACESGCIIKGEDVACVSIVKYRKDKLRRLNYVMKKTEKNA